MGTSKSYSETRRAMIPNWGDLSSAVTKNCDGSEVSSENLGKILSKFVSAIGGSTSAGRGQSMIAGKSGIKTANRLGGFFGDFISDGGNISLALENTGLTDLAGKSAEDIVNHLIEYCSGPSSTIDDNAAKEASRILLEEMVSDAETIEDLEIRLKLAFDNESLEDIVIRYFGYYILEHLSTSFYEKLVKAKGKSHCSNLFIQIRNYIFEELKEVNRTQSLRDINWGGPDASRVIMNIQESVLKIFE